MYTREEASAIRRDFWTKFGQYMSPVPSSSGSKTNWINYKTGVKAIQFKMDAGSKEAIVYIAITGEEEKRIILFNLFQTMKEQLDPSSEWEWEEYYTDEYGKEMARISMQLKPANIFKVSDWPDMISFFKKYMMQLDEFWVHHKDFFEMMS